MQAPAIPVNEAKRMEALNKLNILDTPIQENFERITRITKALFNVPIVAFSLVDSERQWFKSVQGLDVCETSREVSFCGHVINQDKCFIINDATQDPRFSNNPLVTGEPNIRFYAGYPVHTADGLKVGSLCIMDTKPRDFAEKDLTGLKDMVKLVEAELNANDSSNIQTQLSQELDQAKRLARIDGLTRLWNRVGIEDLIHRQISDALKKQENFGIALIDIDNFKAVNDTYGHNAGDAILRNVAKRLLEGYRSSDAVGRWGGEEFLVIMNDGSETTFSQTADQARKVIASTPIMFENLEITITITTGVSCFKWKNPEQIDKLISEADQALYEGKHFGKNVVKISLSVKEKNSTS